jgi:hypothetical protein
MCRRAEQARDKRAWNHEGKDGKARRERAVQRAELTKPKPTGKPCHLPGCTQPAIEDPDGPAFCSATHARSFYAATPWDEQPSHAGWQRDRNPSDLTRLAREAIEAPTGSVRCARQRSPARSGGRRRAH